MLLVLLFAHEFHFISRRAECAMSQTALRLPDTWWRGCRLQKSMYRARRPPPKQTQQTQPFSDSSNERRAMLSALKLSPHHHETAHQIGLPRVPGRRAQRERELILRVAGYLTASLPRNVLLLPPAQVRRNTGRKKSSKRKQGRWIQSEGIHVNQVWKQLVREITWQLLIGKDRGRWPT